jgi:hypothetical protein
MFPEVRGYRVLVWPNRQFTEQARYLTPDAARRLNRRHQSRGIDLETLARDVAFERAPIPRHYNTESLVVLQAIADVLNQKEFVFDSGPTGVGVLVSDAMLFQRQVAPWHAPSYCGLTLPLLKHGLRVEPVHLEHAPKPGFLAAYKVLLLDYEAQKPQVPEVNLALADWVKQGGMLLVFGDGTDPFNRVRQWWNTDGRTYDSPRQHLFEALGLGRAPGDGTHGCGQGRPTIDRRAPAHFAATAAAAAELRALVRQAFAVAGIEYWEQNYFRVRRGPYILAQVFAEVQDVLPLALEGNLVNLFDPELGVLRRKVLYPGEAAFLYDLSQTDRRRPAVVASASRIDGAEAGEGAFRFVSSCAAGTRGATRLRLPAAPASIIVQTAQGAAWAFERDWDEPSGTLFLGYENRPDGVRIELTY